MKRELLAALLLMLVACVGGQALPDEPAPTARNTKMLAHTPTHVFASRQIWEASPWARISDMQIALPVFVVIAGDGSACVVSGADWAIAQAGKRYACAGGWRLWRSR